VLQESEKLPLQEEDLPAIYQAANKNSLEAQKRFLRRSGLGMVTVVIAIGASAFPGRIPLGDGKLMGLIAATAFSGALLLRLYLLTERPEKTWYGGRAAAESAKNLAWRYAVGGAPFAIDQNPDEVDAAFTERLRDILTDLDAESLVPPSGGEGKQITKRMRELRAMSLEERKETYAVGRIQDQMEWYARKAKWNKDRSNLWNTILMSLEFVGLVTAILIATGVRQIDVLGFAGALAGAVIAAGASWLQTKQHSNLAEAYSVTTHELSAINDRISSPRTEEDWARFVSESEDAVSREHTLWRASRITK
jgi:SMODS and SLOG-associating 2TM effector domain 3/SMODS and SLOG-associating 2TM effector domain 1